MPKISQIPGSTQSEIICVKHQWGDGVTISADGKTRTEKEASIRNARINWPQIELPPRKDYKETIEAYRQERVLAMDLGSTYTLGAFIQNGKVQLLSGDEGNKVPSIIFLPPTNSSTTKVGERATAAAKRWRQEGVISFTKRLLGKTKIDSEVLALTQHARYEVIEEPGANAPLKIRAHTDNHVHETTAIEVQAHIIECLIKNYTTITGRERPTHFIAGYPGAFTMAQEAAIFQAFNVAGVPNECLELLHEPIAAALAADMHNEPDHVAAVIDIGGATTDVTLIRKKGGNLQVLAVASDLTLGGEDITREIAKHAKNMLGISNLAREDEALLLAEAERIKLLLAYEDAPVITVHIGGEDLEAIVTREDYADITTDIYRKLETTIDVAVDRAHQQSTFKIDKVILAGGTAKAPGVTELVATKFNIEKSQINGTNDMDEAIVKGLALRATTFHNDILTTISTAIGVKMSSEGRGDRITYLIHPGSALPIIGSIAATVGPHISELRIPIFQGNPAKTSPDDAIHITTVTISPITTYPYTIDNRLKITLIYSLEHELVVKVFDLATLNEEGTPATIANKIQLHGLATPEEIKELIKKNRNERNKEKIASMRQTKKRKMLRDIKKIEKTENLSTEIQQQTKKLKQDLAAEDADLHTIYDQISAIEEELCIPHLSD